MCHVEKHTVYEKMVTMVFYCTYANNVKSVYTLGIKFLLCNCMLQGLVRFYVQYESQYRQYWAALRYRHIYALNCLRCYSFIHLYLLMIFY